jgi:hypothetical protein
MSPRCTGSLAIRALPCIALACTACGHTKLVPAPSAEVGPGASAALSNAGGVRCTAEVDAWAGRPGVLPDFVTPVKVHVLNNSGKPIRLLYEGFVLVGTSGRKYRPIPVVPIDPDPKSAPVNPTYTSWNFFVAPRIHAAYRTMQPWPRPLLRNQNFYERQYHRWGQRRPPMEMIQMALPEGVLREGGVISGFLFFENPIDLEDRVVFQAEFDESDSPETVASMKIPFSVE